MKLHFDSNRRLQHDGINSIVGIFEEQPLNQGDFSFSISVEKLKKVITLDRLFKNNDQLKTKALLQMKDVGIEFNVV